MWVPSSGARVRSSWRWQAALVFLFALHTCSGSPHEVWCVANTLETGYTEALPQRLIGDRAVTAPMTAMAGTISWL